MLIKENMYADERAKAHYISDSGPNINRYTANNQRNRKMVKEMENCN